MAGLRARSARSAPAAATTPSPATGDATYPGRRHLDRRVPDCSACCSRADVLTASRSTCRPASWSRCRPRRPGRRATRIAAALRARGIATEVAPTAAKYGKQIRLRRAARHPVRVVPAGRRQPPGQGHPLRRAGRRRSGGWVPPAEDLRPTIIARDTRRPRTRTTLAHEEHPVIRTHDAGTLRAEHAGTTVTLAGWVARRRDHGGVAFVDLRDASGFVQVVFRDEAGRRTRCATSSACGSSARSRSGPTGNANPALPTGDVEVIATERRGPQRGGAAAVPDRRARRGRRGGAAASYRYLDLRRAGPARGDAAAQPRPTGPPARCCTSATSSRSRRRR